MRVQLIDPDASSARYVYENGAGIEITTFGLYPPTAGDLVLPFAEWLASGGEPEPFMASPASLPDISDRQFGRGLWGERVMTFEECEQFVSVGAIPAALQAIIDQLPDDDTGAPTPRKEAMILVKGAKTYSFANPLVETARAFLAASDPKWTEAYLRERWTEWAQL